MKNLKSIYALIFTLLLTTFSFTAHAGTYANSVTIANGYDVVSYHNSKKPLRGNGNYVAVHEGATYLFANKENQKTFEANPGKYAPAYGGYCAFGVSVGKKFVGDPEVWRVVDGKLYLNLDTGIQSEWLKDVPGRIEAANSKWNSIKDKAPSEL